jgi:hypothetical protein
MFPELTAAQCEAVSKAIGQLAEADEVVGQV